jgi:uncharacterized membrane protein YqjE
VAAFSSEQPSAARPGLITGSVQLLRSAWAYLRSRSELALIEGKEAGVTWLTALALVLGSLFIIVFGYFFLIFAIVFAIAAAMESEHAWIWVTLGAALLHFAGAAVLLLKVKGLVSKPVFQATLEEFKRDQEWLNAKNAKRN